jgi:hypothetical protein
MRVGRPRKQQPWKPGAPAPIKAAGCGPERHLVARAPRRTAGNKLKRTPTFGHTQDLLGTWYHRRKKACQLRHGQPETVIGDRQYMAGRAVERMIEAIAGEAGRLKSVDLTVPVVDSSFVYRMGGSPEYRAAFAQAKRLCDWLGRRDFKYVIGVLSGMGIHGALLHEAGHEWRCPPDRDEDQRSRAVDPRTREKVLNSGRTDVQLAPGILAKGHAYKIVPDFADASKGKSGSFEVEPGIKERPVYSPHKIPHGTTLPDKGAAIEQAAKAAVAYVVEGHRIDITRETLRDQMDDLKLEIKRGGDAKEIRLKEQQRDELESQIVGDLVEMFEIAARALKQRHPEKEDFDKEAWREMRRNPPPNAAGHGKSDLFVRDAGNSIGSTTDIADVGSFSPWETRKRAVDMFGVRGIEQGSLRFRELLKSLADFFEVDHRNRELAAEPAAMPAQITQRNAVPFDAGTFEDAVFEELEPVAVRTCN